MKVDIDRTLMRTKDLLLLAGIAWAAFSAAGDLILKVKTVEREQEFQQATIKELETRIIKLEQRR